MALTAAQRIEARKQLAEDQLAAIDAAIAIFQRPELKKALVDLQALRESFPAGSGAGETYQNLVNLLSQGEQGMQFRRDPIAAEVASYNAPAA